MIGTNPALRRRQLGSRLRALRKAAGFGIEDAARHLECSPAKISRIETGQRGTIPRDVRDLCQFYGVTDHGEIEALVTLAREAKQPGLRQEWEDLGAQVVYTYLELESSATLIVDYELTHIPALLQTERYARVLIRGVLPQVDDDVLESRVHARMSRQAALSQTPAPRYWGIIEESVLHRPIGGAEVMADQLDHVLRIAQLSNVTILVVPYSDNGHMGLNNQFVFLELPDPSVPALVYLETLTISEYLEKPRDVAAYREAVDHLRAVALDPERSARLIAEFRDGYAK